MRFGNAQVSAHQQVKFKIEDERFSCLFRRYIDWKDDLVLVAEIINVESDKALRRGPENADGFKIYRSRPVEYRRQPRLPRCAPVGLPAGRELDLHADANRVETVN